MRRRAFFGYSFVGFAAGILTACSSTISPENIQASAAKEPEAIRFAVTDVKGLEELQRDYGPFRQALEAATGRKVEFFPVADRTAAVVAFEADQVDLVFTGPAEYVILRNRTNAVPVIAVTRPNYYSVIAVRVDSGLGSLEQLKGKQLAMTDIGSTSGHLGPSKILADAGLDPQSDLKVLMLGKTGLQALKNGDVDAWGGSAIDYERFLDAEKIKPDQFPIIAKGQPLPSDVIIASSKLSPETVENLRQQMVQGQDKLLEAITAVSANKKFRGGKLVPVKDEDYESMRQAYRAIGVNDFSQFVGN